MVISIRNLFDYGNWYSCGFCGHDCFPVNVKFYWSFEENCIMCKWFRSVDFWFTLIWPCNSCNSSNWIPLALSIPKITARYQDRTLTLGNEGYLHIISRNWHGTGRWNSSLWKTGFGSYYKYKGCWWYGEAGSQGTSNHGIDLVIPKHCRDVIISAMVSHITGVSIVYSSVCSKKTSNLRVTGLCEGNSPVNSPHKGPVTRKLFL